MLEQAASLHRRQSCLAEPDRLADLGEVAREGAARPVLLVSRGSHCDLGRTALRHQTRHSVSPRQCEPHDRLRLCRLATNSAMRMRVLPDLVERPGRLPMAKAPGPTAEEAVDLSHDLFDRCDERPSASQGRSGLSQRPDR